ncbi:helix-turn-helix transcriptional regulator [Rapidithrix thailandica]|uniref:Helix-turn-helix transcriptional regulator n=1 Tax=Rapidithrix thailandica TaxID=413964 RepID=A0AAW9S1Q9_9BACT
MQPLHLVLVGNCDVLLPCFLNPKRPIDPIKLAAFLPNMLDAMNFLQRNQVEVLVISDCQFNTFGKDFISVIKRMSIHTYIIVYCSAGTMEKSMAGSSEIDRYCVSLEEFYQSLNHLIACTEERLKTPEATTISPEKLYSLTKREQEVIELIAQGQRYKSIAQQLNISPGTVDKHRKNIQKKLGVPSAAELMTLLQQGY